MVLTGSTKRNRFIKRFLAVGGVLVVIIFLLQLWFIHNAHLILEKYITEQSDGKIKLELKRLDLNVFTKRLQIHEATLLSTDSLTQPITYQVTFSKLSIKVSSIRKLLFERKLLLDSLKVYNPDIRVMKWREDTARLAVKDELSLPQEMGKVYNTLLDVLDAFVVRRIRIDNAKINLINKMEHDAEPISVSNIFFDLTRTPVKKGTKYIYLKDKQTVELRSSDQDIRLAGGRHRLSFKSFTLRLFRQSIELDSCTVTALATDSLKSNYKIFFKKLLLTGVDFAALSAKNVIKADTVYCESPYFDFNLYRSDAVVKETEIPDADKILRELSGNLNLAFVAVKNAGIHFDIYGQKKRTFFNSNKDNFEIHGLRINPDSLKPIAIRQFDMTMKNYQLYNEDSTSLFSFDKIHFLNKKIILNNFTFLSKPGSSQLRNEVDIKVPYFELSELNWYQLIFDQVMVAQEAILKNPVINFKRRKAGIPGKKLHLFKALVNLDSLVVLDNVSVSRGHVNIQLGPSTSFSVQSIDFKIRSNKLLSAANKEDLRDAIEHLSFSKGILRLKDLTAELQNTTFTADNLIYADKVAITGLRNKIAATVNNVYIDNLQFDDQADTIEVDGLKWGNAQVVLKALPTANSMNNGSSNIHLRNIAGNKTQLNFFGGQTVISTYVQTLNATSLIQKGSEIRADGLNLVGNNLVVNRTDVNVSADSYIVGSDSSSLINVLIHHINERDSLSIRSPNINLSASLNDLFADNLYFKNVHATAPVIKLNKWNSVAGVQDSSISLSFIRLEKVTAVEPDIMIATHRNDSVTVINIPRSDNSMVEASDIVISGEVMQIGSLLANTTAATFEKSTGETVGIGKGKIDLSLSDIQLGEKNGKTKWSGFINSLALQNAKGFNIGEARNKVSFKQATLGNLSLSSELLTNFSQLIQANVSAWLRIPEGQFIDSSTTVTWHNAHYDNSSKTLSLDSMEYHPSQPLDSVLAHAMYELDYVTLKTGAVTINGLDAERYERDSSFIANTININKPVLTVFRDKKSPDTPLEKDKPFPVKIIRNLSLPVLVQSIQLKEGTITYSEKNAKSRKRGTVSLTNVSGSIRNIKNNDISDGDSLWLTVNASLMDSAEVTLSLKESYTDSINRFSWRAKIKSADLTILNPILIPLANVKITSGVLDSVSMWSVNRDDVALGEMNMRYRKLRIKLIKNGNPDQSTFLHNVLSFIANTFIIKSNNTTRKGIMYYENPGNKSFISYIIKTTLSGTLTSIGIKKNRKYMKQYEQELKAGKRSPIKL